MIRSLSMLKPALVALAFLGVASPAFAQNPYRTELVRFAKGASSATVTGSIRADGGVSYALTCAPARR
jgi:ABC-type nitrate/sulfonate/bicarbonate transport system substrate-binding protein